MWQRGCALLRACGGPGLFAAAVLAQPSSAAFCLGLDGGASAAHATPRAWLRDARDGDGALFERALGVRAAAGLPRHWHHGPGPPSHRRSGDGAAGK
jgi:hypothetical protein